MTLENKNKFARLLIDVLRNLSTIRKEDKNENSNNIAGQRAFE